MDDMAMGPILKRATQSWAGQALEPWKISRVRCVLSTRPSVTVDFNCKRNHYLQQSKKKYYNQSFRDLLKHLSSTIDHFATSLQKKMKVSRISTQFSCRLDLLDSMILRIYCLLELGLDLVVGLVFDNLQNFCASDFSMRLLRDNQVEWPSEQYFLIC